MVVFALRMFFYIALAILNGGLAVALIRDDGNAFAISALIVTAFLMVVAVARAGRESS